MHPAWFEGWSRMVVLKLYSMNLNIAVRIPSIIKWEKAQLKQASAKQEIYKLR